MIFLARPFLFGWGVLAIGCVLIITGDHGKSLFSWVIAFGLAIWIAGWYQYRCRDCSSPSSILHVHHITRVGAGGTHHLSNLVTLYPKCHLDKHPSKRSG